MGQTKAICLPGLNCYSCPGALGSCPIGALQSVLSSRSKSFSFYVTGLLLFFGVVFGRVICGFLCPFGLVQDLLYKIKTRKLNVIKQMDIPLRYLKYVILVVFVILMPIFITNDFGMGNPTFCKYICPSGTLFASLPLLSTNELLRNSIGNLFNLKLFILMSLLSISVFINRPFCKYICPLGAIYGFFNRHSFIQLAVDKSSCINCKACEKNCPMDVEVLKDINSNECIRCGKCVKNCPTKCINTKKSNA